MRCRDTNARGEPCEAPRGHPLRRSGAPASRSRAASRRRRSPKGLGGSRRRARGPPRPWRTRGGVAGYRLNEDEDAGTGSPTREEIIARLEEVGPLGREDLEKLSDEGLEAFAVAAARSPQLSETTRQGSGPVVAPGADTSRWVAAGSPSAGASTASRMAAAIVSATIRLPFALR